MATPFTFKPIGILRSCFAEKFGVPRQSMMISEARGIVKLNARAEFREALNHLDGFSHLWIVYVFDRNIDKGWQPTVQPPRLEAPKNVGVFASRSPHRPNPIGLSVVKLDRIDREAHDGIELHVSGVDILDDTPILDIKPYLPFADSHAAAQSGWASEEIPKYSVSFSPESLHVINAAGCQYHPNLLLLLTQMLEIDPRPTSQKSAHPLSAPNSDGLPFAFRLFDFDIQWKVQNAGIHVVRLLPLK